MSYKYTALTPNIQEIYIYIELQVTNFDSSLKEKKKRRKGIFPLEREGEAHKVRGKAEPGQEVGQLLDSDRWALIKVSFSGAPG